MPTLIGPLSSAGAAGAGAAGAAAAGAAGAAGAAAGFASSFSQPINDAEAPSSNNPVESARRAKPLVLLSMLILWSRDRAAKTVAGQSAEEYLRTAITTPDAYLAGGYQEGIMYRDYAQALTVQQIDDLVAYMLTLKSGQDN